MTPPNDCLVRLLGGYFHDGWTAEHRTAEECLGRMLDEAPAELRRGAAAELDALLSARLCESKIRDVLLYEIGCAYALEADGLEASSWLRHVEKRLHERNTRSEPRAASGRPSSPIGSQTREGG